MDVIIIEPAKGAYERLLKLLQEAEPRVKVIARLQNIKESIRWFKANPLPDLVFSAITLPDGLSFDLFNKITSKPPVIFTCSNEKYARAAFNTTGIFYLLKPVKVAELKLALQKFRNNFKPAAKEQSYSLRTYQKRFLVNIGKQTRLIAAEEIAYFFADKKVVYVVCFDGSKYIFNATLEKLETILDPENFFRINRQFIVNLSSITKMTPASKSRQQLFLKPRPLHTTITSSGRTAEFYKWLVGN